jgi:hypothetical protein
MYQTQILKDKVTEFSVKKDDFNKNFSYHRKSSKDDKGTIKRHIVSSLNNAYRI